MTTETERRVADRREGLVPPWTAADEAALSERVTRLAESATREPTLTWGSPWTWIIEDHMGDRSEVDVEPRLDLKHAVGDELDIGGELFRLVGRRGRMIVIGG